MRETGAPGALPEGYEIRELPQEEFSALWQKHAPAIFDDGSHLLRLDGILSGQDQARSSELGATLGQRWRVNLAVFRGDEFVGWSFGYLENGQTFYMCNSAVLPAHRRRGLYSALLRRIMDAAIEKGFQRIYGRHLMTNNAVLIPKLKAGFVITGFELSDEYGAMAHLSYFANPARRKVLDYRAGLIRPDDEIRGWMRM
jgi:ribosomal protein S18 acetylase RimI-like enzyme